jgi:putative ABC transport system permease protein
MIYLRSALRELQRRPGRWLMSLASVVIAVAAIVAVSSATITTRMAYQQVFETLAGRADLEVVARAGGSFEQTISASIREVPLTRALVPVFHRGTIIYAGEGEKVKAVAVGIVADEPESLAGFQVASGSLPKTATEISVQSSIAQALGIQAGSSVRLLTSRGLRRYTISGIVDPETAVRLRQGGMVLAQLQPLQRAFKAPGMVDALQIYLAPETDPHKAIDTYAPLLPPELKVQVPSSRSGLAEETLQLTHVSLNMASALSFTTAIFIVLSVFLMNVGERRRQLATLRAVGATRRQVMRLVGTEALVMGIAGTLAGIPLGVYGASFLIRSMADLLQTSLPEAPNLGWAIAVGALVGPLLCLLAAWYPARQAAQVSPLEGMRPVADVGRAKRRRWTTALALAGLVVSALLTLASARGDIGDGAAVAGLIVALVSLVLLIPLVLRPAVALVGYPLRRLLGVEGEMSKRIVLRRITRSSLTIGVLFIAMAAAVGTSNAVFSITEDVQTWYERTITADFLLRPMMPDMTGEKAPSMSEALRGKLTGLDGVEMVDAVSLVRVEVGGQQAMVMARDFNLYDDVPLDIIGGDESQLAAELRHGAAVVGSVLAEKAKIRPGDTVRLTFGDETYDFHVAAIATDYTFGGAVVFVDRTFAARILPIPGVDTYLIKARRDRLAQLKPQLQALADKEGLLLQSFVELVRLIDSMVAGVTGGLWVLLALGLLVGAIGVVNTLTMNVIEQTRELGMLRSIGMRRRQIEKTVLAQALFLGAIGILSGAILGLLLARSINLSLASMFGRYVPFSWNLPFVGLLVAAALVVVLAAALPPARRAARLNPILAMREE